MKNLRYISAFLAIFLLVSLFSMPVMADNDPLPVPSVDAKAALLIERNSGRVLFEQNVDDKVYPASLTKIMTCLLTLENGTLSDTVTVSETALDNLDEAGSTVGLLAGEMLSLENLLYSIMLSSANEACNVAAEYVSGNVADFVQKMNDRAAELGCTGTHFANTHGLHDEEHYTTARDLSLIVQEALKNNTFRTIVSSYTYTLPATNLSPEKTLKTTNELIIPKQSNPYYDSRVTGVKTGFTTPAGRCLISTAEAGSLSLLSVVCGCETKILESGDLQFGSFVETKKLLDYGFSNFTFQTVLTTLYPIAEIPVSRSAGADFVSLAPKTEISALLPIGYSEDELVVSSTLNNPEGVSAPVSAGDELGTVTISLNGEELGSCPLVAITDVERGTFFDLMNPTKYKTQAWLRIILLLVIILFLLFLVAVALRKSQRKRQKKHRQNVRKMQQTARNDFDDSNWYNKE